MLIGIALFFNSMVILYWFGVFFVLKNIYLKFHEEPELEGRFGKTCIKLNRQTSYAEDLQYRQHVPMWIPRLTPYTVHQ